MRHHHDILIVDDEPQLRRMLALMLEAEGRLVRTAGTGEAALREAAAATPDAIILDLSLPDMDGSEVLTALRGWSAAPVLVLSARQETGEKIRLLEAGADDYLPKPFDPDELKARLRALLRRAPSGGSETERACDDLLVDLAHHSAQVKGEPLDLTPTEFQILALLCREAGKVVTYDRLLGAIFGPGGPDYREYLRVYIVHLRRKLREAHGVTPTIETVTGAGYRIIPSVVRPE